MGDAGGFFRGTSAEQDARFSDKYKKYVAGRKFPPEFDLKVDLRKVAMDAIKPWVSARITQLLGFEDEVLIGFAFGLLDDKESLNPKELQLNLDGFLEADAPHFVADLWKLLLSAQASPGGIPAEFLEQKKAQLRQKREEESRVKSDLSAVISRDKEGVVHETHERRPQHTPLPHATPASTAAVTAGGGGGAQHTRAALPYGLYVPDSSSSKQAGDLAGSGAIKDDSSSVAEASRGSSRRDRGADSDRDRHRSRPEHSRERRERDRRSGDADRDRDRRRRDRDRDRDRDRRGSSRRERSRSRERRKDDDRGRERERERHRKHDEDDHNRNSDEGNAKKRSSSSSRRSPDHQQSSSPTKRPRTDDAEAQQDDPLVLESALREQAMHSLLRRSRD